MKKDEIIELYNDISEIGMNYGADIDTPVKETQYEYIRSSLNTLANVSEDFQEHGTDFYSKRKENLRDLAEDISKAKQNLRDSHNTEAALLLYRLAEEKGLDTDITKKDFTAMGKGPRKSLKALIETHLED